MEDAGGKRSVKASRAMFPIACRSNPVAAGALRAVRNNLFRG
jgi:hypothetical protein